MSETPIPVKPVDETAIEAICLNTIELANRGELTAKFIDDAAILQKALLSEIVQNRQQQKQNEVV